jgi:hypothetical protein
MTRSERRGVLGFVGAMLLAVVVMTAAAWVPVKHHPQPRWLTVSYVRPYGQHGCVVRDPEGFIYHINRVDLCDWLRAHGRAEMTYADGPMVADQCLVWRPATRA